MKGSALLVVDVQNDFCPGGALGVEAGDRVIPPLNEYIHRFRARGLPVFVTRDWHPARTTHFREWGGPWPPHCVQHTAGAQFHSALDIPENAVVISKGMDPEQDSYSAFHGFEEGETALVDSLRRRGVDRIFIGGLATDYCVKESVLDAGREGFEAVVLLDAIAGIDVHPGDVDRALESMRAAGARTATLDSVDELLEEDSAHERAGHGGPRAT